MKDAIYICIIVVILVVCSYMLDHAARTTASLTGQLIACRSDYQISTDIIVGQQTRAENCYYRLSQCLADEFIEEVIAGREPLHVQLWNDEETQ